MKRESALKSAFLKVFQKELPHFVAQRHEDVRTNGVPDLSVDGNKMTSWFEFKHCTPTFTSNERQELMMCRLAIASFARYVMWREDKDGLFTCTLIVHPKEVLNRKNWVLPPEAQCDGFDHQWLVQYMKRIHGLSM